MSLGVQVIETWARGYKTFFMLNSAEHEILNTRNYKNIEKLSIFQAQIIFPAERVEMPTFVGISTFMSRKKPMVS